MKINPTIFREYDIRGVIDTGLSEKAVLEYEKWYGTFPGITIRREDAEAIGKAYGTVIVRGGGAKVVVGHEIRPGADMLTDAFIAGVRTTGCAVVDLGVSLTPIVYFMTAHGGYDGGVNITGSHNVYFFNGFKLMKKDVWPLFSQELQGMRILIEKEDFIKAEKLAVLETLDAFSVYSEYLLSHIKLARPLKIVIDCGNGSAGVFAPEVFKKLGCEVIGLYIDSDATFPNHIPDPEQRQFYGELQRLVVSTKADLGIAFDADGDRVGFVDERGEFIEADEALLIFARAALSRNKGKKILYDVKCSQIFEELIPQFGGVPFMHRTGHGPIKETMRKDSEIIFAGETSGHFYFVEDYYKIDDGLWAAARMLEILAAGSAPASGLAAGFPRRVRTPEFKLPCADGLKFDVVRAIQQSLCARYEAITLDGVRIRISRTGWGLVRASNTSPYLTVKLEGETEKEALAIKNILADELEKHPEVGERLDGAVIARLGGKLGWI